MATLLLVIIYVCFINLGLPDSIIGSSWPEIFVEFAVSKDTLSYISLIGSVISITMSFFAGKLIKKLGTPLLVAISVTLTASSILGMFLSRNIYVFALSCLPLGAGAGAVDVSLNAFVAKYYKSREMSWLHCFWGLGASASTLIVSAFADTNWHTAFLVVSIIQFATAIVLFCAIPLWNKVTDKKDLLIAQLENAEREQEDTQQADKLTVDGQLPPPSPELMQESGVKAKSIKRKPLIFARGVMLACLSFFCYCALENITGTWGNTYLVTVKGLSTGDGAVIVSLFYIGITVGRFINGFLTLKVKDQTLIFGGVAVILLGVVLLLIGSHPVLMYLAFGFIGLGCAPIYPSSMQLTTSRFSREFTPEILGFQTAFAGIGITIATPVFGIVAQSTTFKIFPFILLGFIVLQIAVQFLIINRTMRKDNK